MGPEKLSFVIPTRNEERHIAGVIRAIRNRMSGKQAHEIIVVDNGSTDSTVECAEQLGVRTFVEPGLTVAGLRNLGAGAADGSVFVFLDGDVYLTDRWIEKLPKTLAALRSDPNVVTGSRCGISSDPGWIERWWFGPLLSERANYMNSGHLITTRRLFEALGGFREDLVTGEDYDFSMRARQWGAKIVNDPELAVIHEGYPKSLRSFIRREIWHGQGNLTSLGSIMRSKVALLASVFLLLHAVVLASLLIHGGTTIVLTGTGLLGLLCLLASAVKYGPSPAEVLVNSYLYYFYFWGRGLSLLSVLYSRVVR